jgi:sulfite exporter TauE/SafE
VTQIITYHIGRLTAYGTIGLVFGLVGKGFFYGRNSTEFINIYRDCDDSRNFDSGEDIRKI